MQADVVVVVGRGVAAGGGPTYLINQGFEGAGYDNSETWSEAAGTPDEDYSNTGFDMEGSQCLELNGSLATERTDTPAYAATADTWVYFKIRFNALPGGTESIVSVRNGTTELCTAQITATGTWRVAMPDGNSSPTTAAMSTGTTYKCRIRYTAGSGANGFGSFEFVAIGGTFDASGTDFTSKNNSNATLSSTNNRLRIETTIQLWIDSHKVDDVEIGSNPS